MDAWRAYEADLVHRFRNLDDGEFVIVEGPARTVERRTGIFRRGIKVDHAHLYTQLLRMENVLYCEIVGGPHIRGNFPWTDEEDSALRSLGWGKLPGPKSEPVYCAYVPDPAPEFNGPYLDGAVAQQAAQLIVRSLRDVAAVSSPQELRIETG